MIKTCLKVVFAAASKAALLVLFLLFFPGIVAAQTTPLERNWQLLADQTGALKVSELASAPGWRDVRVGLSWNAQFADLRDYMGVAWYRTRFDAPPLEQGKHALLRFGAVDYFSEIFINRKSMGSHEGAST